MPSSVASSVASSRAPLADEIQFIPTRLLDDLIQRRPLTHTVTDDLSSFTIVTLRALLKRISTEGQSDTTEQELLALLSTQSPFQLWQNRQQVRDMIKGFAEEAEDSDGSVDSRASSCSRGFAPFVPALHDMLEVNDEQRWETHRLRAEGKLDRITADSQITEQYYREYLRALRRMPEDIDQE
ncbi:hypothetical protein L226DRAFT_566179 [Lentinus tigrinus ALCF2SS1-7]|uniref:Uncharacterized protein n=1 Tax=Lentinus tigrinus ALCF2SS1-6 TaxID=1328759 RepID=A0A5C2SVP1_9APHY|nr:hypothetical protein L227DRAFT_648522 [Lentinus tigrinus ALCF2SS1-6]RPD81402.1 hypothetical protein L226DRAFT_566179 [Lentinus tigrinus ALCF2SS1-7]